MACWSRVKRGGVWGPTVCYINIIDTGTVVQFESLIQIPNIIELRQKSRQASSSFAISGESLGSVSFRWVSFRPWKKRGEIISRSRDRLCSPFHYFYCTAAAQKSSPEARPRCGRVWSRDDQLYSPDALLQTEIEGCM